MTEPRVTLKGPPALLAMRLLSLVNRPGEYVIHLDTRRGDCPRWRVSSAGAWEKQHQEGGESIDINVS